MTWGMAVYYRIAILYGKNMTNQPLLDFVKNQTQLGLSRDAITNMLLGQGWTVADVNEAFATVEALNPVHSSPVPIPPVAPVSPIPTSGGYAGQFQPQPQPQQPQKPRGRIFASAVVVVIVILCLIGGGVFAYYKFMPLSPSQIFENALRATMGHTASLAFEATTTGSIATVQASAYGLPSAAVFSVGGSGAVDFHSRFDPLGSLDLAFSAESSSSNDSDSLQFSLDTIFAGQTLYLNLRNFNVSVQMPSDQQETASIVAAVNAFAQRAENQWVSIPAASSTIPSSSTPEIQSQVAEIDNYVFGMSYVKAISNLGQESVDGTQTYHLNVTLQDNGQLTDLIRNISLQQQPDLATSTEFATQMTNLSQTLSRPINIDVWIGTADFRIYRIAVGPLSFTDPQSGTVSTSSYQADFSDYGRAMGIVAPSSSISLQQMIQNLFKASPVAGYAAPTGESSLMQPPQELSASDIVALKDTVQAFKQGFLSDNEQEVLQYSSAASQNTLKINQLNTAYQSLAIKSISGISTQAEVVMTGVSDGGATVNLGWVFIKEDGVWKFDLGMTEQLSNQI